MYIVNSQNENVTFIVSQSFQIMEIFSHIAIWAQESSDSFDGSTVLTGYWPRGP
jgi:hypothetical protein